MRSTAEKCPHEKTVACTNVVPAERGMSSLRHLWHWLYRNVLYSLFKLNKEKNIKSFTLLPLCEGNPTVTNEIPLSKGKFVCQTWCHPELNGKDCLWERMDLIGKYFTVKILPSLRSGFRSKHFDRIILPWYAWFRFSANIITEFLIRSMPKSCIHIYIDILHCCRRPSYIYIQTATSTSIIYT